VPGPLHALSCPAPSALQSTLTTETESVHLPLVSTYQRDAWTALGDPTRRAIFERLVDGPCAVVELASGLTVSRPAVSQHLKVLKEAGLVADRPAGTRRIYRVDPDGLAALRADLERFWDKTLGAYKTALDNKRKEKL
jgi:DNA-binding transcriptional ArsR family regulator